MKIQSRNFALPTILTETEATQNQDDQLKELMKADTQDRENEQWGPRQNKAMYSQFMTPLRKIHFRTVTSQYYNMLWDLKTDTYKH